MAFKFSRSLGIQRQLLLREGIDRPWHRLAALRLNQLTCLAARPRHKRVVLAKIELLILEHLPLIGKCGASPRGKCMVKVKYLDEERFNHDATPLSSLKAAVSVRKVLVFWVFGLE